MKRKEPSLCYFSIISIQIKVLNVIMYFLLFLKPYSAVTEVLCLFLPSPLSLIWLSSSSTHLTAATFHLTFGSHSAFSVN